MLTHASGKAGARPRPRPTPPPPPLPPRAELTQRAATAERDAAYPNPEGAHEQRVAELEGAAAEAREGVDQLSGELRALEEQRRALKLRFAELHERSEQVERMVAEAEPQTRCRGFSCGAPPPAAPSSCPGAATSPPAPLPALQAQPELVRARVQDHVAV
jgi:hypothetical protein